MDIMHDMICDAAQPFFPEYVDKTSWKTQAVVYYLILSLGGAMFYLSFAGASFYHSFVWKRDKYYPASLKDVDIYKQAKTEIGIALSSLWKMAFLMWPGAFFSHRGYSKIYKKWPETGEEWQYFALSSVAFLVFTDFMIYWMHRGLHHPWFYRRIHKLHHAYQYTTPFSSHAFHPVDGFAQGCPYYIFVYLVPFNNIQFFLMFVIVNSWTVSIHDQIDFGSKLISSTGHHTIHHADFWYNYGQYTTFWDRLCGTYMPAVQTHSWDGTKVGQKKVE
eukprot:TRINITY_DN47150_c0_g1_i1.p1 TRINITY_DN47150_c0_g1~~TRINITY_DN47150_c0_g1_i1.p1  ORF type:complete len:275 (+),score=58.86 TRINITY_DN47150_c0_g1_i1:50-874(+)